MRAKLTLLLGLKTSLVGAQKAGVRTSWQARGSVYYVWSGLGADVCCHGRVPGLTGLSRGAQVLLSNPTCAGQHQHHHSSARYLVCDWVYLLLSFSEASLWTK